MRVHLVSYATPRFQLRQRLLGLSARWNRVADSVTSWNPAMLVEHGFSEAAPEIRLSERGSGFWAWKPFIIRRKLEEVPDGDLVYYCDVGRLYPFKLLDQPVEPYLQWMEANNQDVMPGVKIPWDGTVGEWTRRAVLQELDVDRAEIHAESPIQASFSLWRASDFSRGFARRWWSLCSQRHLVSDDPDLQAARELPQFRGHRHDQALLSLCCLKENLVALELGDVEPPYDSRDPSSVSRDFAGPVSGYPTFAGRLLRVAASSLELFEKQVRKVLKFGNPVQE